MFSKRAQAALEFIMTYGWAIMVLLVMVGALAYFGVFDASQWIPERCTFSQEFTCRDFIAEVDTPNPGETLLRFYLQNNLGVPVRVGGFSAEYLSAGIVAKSCDTPSGSLGSGDQMEINCSFTDAFPEAGTKVRIRVDGEYVEVTGRYNHSFSGDIAVTLR